jgi:hypothetical protein
LIKNKTHISKLKKAAKLATTEARRQNKALGLKVLVAKKDGLYYKDKSNRTVLQKKGNFRPLRVKNRVIKIA